MTNMIKYVFHTIRILQIQLLINVSFKNFDEVPSSLVVFNTLLDIKLMYNTIYHLLQYWNT